MRRHSPWLSTHRASWLTISSVCCACMMCLTSSAVPGPQVGVKDAQEQAPTIAVKRLDVGHCLPLPAQKRYLVVEDRERLMALLDGNRPERCADFKMPEVDFDKFTLLGLGIGADCGDALEPHVIRDEATKEYRVTGEYPACAGLRTDYRWYTLPKLPQGFKVTIIINGYNFVTEKREQ